MTDCYQQQTTNHHCDAPRAKIQTRSDELLDFDYVQVSPLMSGKSRTVLTRSHFLLGFLGEKKKRRKRNKTPCYLVVFIVSYVLYDAAFECFIAAGLPLIRDRVLKKVQSSKMDETISGNGQKRHDSKMAKTADNVS